MKLFFQSLLATLLFTLPPAHAQNVLLNPTASQTITQPSATTLNIVGAGSVNNIQFASPSTTGTTTCGIQEAENALPSTGGEVELFQGSCTLTTGVTITKPGIVEGQGSGGTNSATISLGTIIAGTTLINGSPTTNLLTVTPPASGALNGVILRDFAIKGYGTGGSAGDNIQILGNSTSALYNIFLEDLLSYNGFGNGLSILNNAFIISVYNSQFLLNGGNGVSVSNPAGGVAGQLRFYSDISFLNAQNGFYFNNTSGSDIHLYGVTSANNGVASASGDGIYSPSTDTSNVYSDGGSFEQNGNAGIAELGKGYYQLSGNNFPADGTQAYGFYDSPAAATGGYANAAYLVGNSFGSNTTADLYFGANVTNATVADQFLRRDDPYFLITDNSAGGVVWLTNDYIRNTPTTTILNQQLLVKAPISTTTNFEANGAPGFSGTKTAGACTLTISMGLITSVTGC